MRLRRLAATAAVTVLTLPAAGCGGQPPPASPERELITLGVLDDPGPKGAAAPARGVELAIDEYNRADSRYKAVLKQITTDGSPADSVAGAERLAKTERVVGVVGPLGDDNSAAAAAVFEQAEIPFLTTAVDAEDAPKPGWKSFRRLVADAGREARALVRYEMRRIPGSLYIFHDDTAMGNAFSTGAREVVESAKRPNPRYERIGAKTDLQSVAEPIGADPPGIVVFGGDGGLGGKFADELRKAKYKGAIVLSHQVLAARPTGTPDGLTTSSPVADPADRAVAGFVSRYSKKYGARPGPLAAEAYEGAVMLLEAAEEVDPKAKEVVEFFRLNRSFLGETKAYEYDEAGELRSPVVWVYKSRGGAWALAGRSGTGARAPSPAAAKR